MDKDIIDTFKQMSLDISSKWDSFADTGSLCIDQCEAILQIVKHPTVAFYPVEMVDFKGNSGDLLIGFGIKQKATSLVTDIRIVVGKNEMDNLSILRGQKKLLNHPIPLISIQKHTPDIGVECDDPDGIYAICVFCIHDYRKMMAQERFVSGRWLYNYGTFTSLASFLENHPHINDQQLPHLTIDVVKRNFGSLQFHSNDEIAKYRELVNS
jgi:hypothetical protein